MVVLALPFAYLHFRQAALQAMFSGRHGGHQLLLLNNVFRLRRQPAKLVSWLTAAAPGLIYCVVTGRLWLAGAAALARRSPFWRANSLIPHP